MKYALLNAANKILQIEPTSFPVAKPLRWIEVPDSAQVNWTSDGETASPLPDDVQLVSAKAAKTSELKASAGNELSGVFISDVTGSLHCYDLSTRSELSNLVAAAARNQGAPAWKKGIWCTPVDTEKRIKKAHTAKEVQDLNEAIVDWIDARYDHLNALLEQVEAVAITTDLFTALVELNAITWE
jgi:hypothetical protein